MPLSLVPGSISLLTLAVQGVSEPICIAANSITALGAAALFLLYFASSLHQAAHSGVARFAAALRPAQDKMLHGCALAAAAQLTTAACLCLSYPRHGEGALVPLYGAGYVCLAILAASQQGRRLRGRVRFEIEAGEGERHSVMAQGARLAARDYTWAILALHLLTQAAAGLPAMAAALVGGGAGAGLPVGAAASTIALAVAYGVLAALYGVAGAFKYVPALRSTEASATE
ncbi:hypothetical protein GPECTOR_5g315 [Gonium pectorale]|uniref:Uncharacterized protein n=1 Tax=Gonium pectorale TaxID=33097 RepID=A0A150GWT0_GONPE|nr:hypothetical protein GPECTOR_5g315 [Gonium pectorale]|eukprot:KXZ54223.1 hypothetical protein GPECTOR_5g315 [Gonium pectorale]